MHTRCSGLARVTTLTTVQLKSSPNIFLRQVRMVTKINRNQKSHVANLTDSQGWGIVDPLYDPKTATMPNP